MPSINNSPASTAGSTDLENGHVKVSVSIQRQSPFTLERPCSRTVDLALGARPRTLPNRVKWKRPFLCASRPAVDFCYNKNNARARPRASDPRKVPAGGRFHPRRIISPPLPVRACLACPACGSPSLSREKGGQRATTHLRSLSQAAQKPPESKAPKPTTLLGAACEAAPRDPPSVAPRVVETMGNVRAWADEPRAKGRPTLRKLCLRRERDGSPPPTSSSTPWSSVCHASKGWRHPSYDTPIKAPVFDALREEERRRGNQDAFHPPRNPAHGGFCHRVCRLELDSRSRRPSLMGGDIAKRRRAPFSPLLDFGA